MLIEPKFLRRQPGVEGYQFADIFELSEEDQTRVISFMANIAGCRKLSLIFKNDYKHLVALTNASSCPTPGERVDFDLESYLTQPGDLQAEVTDILTP